MHNSRQKEGFTLIELLVVIAIIKQRYPEIVSDGSM